MDYTIISTISTSNSYGFYVVYSKLNINYIYFKHSYKDEKLNAYDGIERKSLINI